MEAVVVIACREKEAGGYEKGCISWLLDLWENDVSCQLSASLRYNN